MASSFRLSVKSRPFVKTSWTIAPTSSSSSVHISTQEGIGAFIFTMFNRRIMPPSVKSMYGSMFVAKICFAKILTSIGEIPFRSIVTLLPVTMLFKVPTFWSSSFFPLSSPIFTYFPNMFAKINLFPNWSSSTFDVYFSPTIFVMTSKRVLFPVPPIPSS